MLLLCTINSVLFTDAKIVISYVCNMSESYVTDMKTNDPIQDIAGYCKDFKKPCVPKCCGLDEVLVREEFKVNNRTRRKWPKCTSVKELGLDKADYAQLEIFNSSVENGVSQIGKNFLEDFRVVRNRIFENRTCVERWNTFTPYLLEVSNNNI